MSGCEPGVPPVRSDLAVARGIIEIPKPLTRRALAKEMDAQLLVFDLARLAEPAPSADAAAPDAAAKDAAAGAGIGAGD